MGVKRDEYEEVVDVAKRYHKLGHWGNHEGLISYIMVVGIFLVAFIFLLLIN